MKESNAIDNRIGNRIRFRQFGNRLSREYTGTTAFPALSSPDKYLGGRTAEILQPSFDRFSLSMASTGCRHGATARPDLDKIDQLSRLLLIENVFVTCF